MKKSSILLLVISVTGLLLGNIASFLTIGRLYANDFNIFHIVNGFDFTNLSFITLFVVLCVSILCLLIHFIFVCIRKKPKYLGFTFLVLIGSLCSAYTLPFTLIETVNFLGDIEANKSDTNIVNAVACIGTCFCLILALISLGLSVLSMGIANKEKKQVVTKTNSETIILNSSKDENILSTETKENENKVENNALETETKKEEASDVELKNEKLEESIEEKEEIKTEELNVENETKQIQDDTPNKPVAPSKKIASNIDNEKGNKNMEKTPVTKEEKKVSATKAYHVVKRKEDNKWTVKLANGEKVIKTFATKEEALAFSKGLAERQNGTLRVHASKGKSKGKIQKQ